MEIQSDNSQHPYRLSCWEFAKLNLVKPESVRSRICRTGEYFGVVPKRLANGRLVFPDVQVEK